MNLLLFLGGASLLGYFVAKICNMVKTHCVRIQAPEPEADAHHMTIYFMYTCCGFMVTHMISMYMYICIYIIHIRMYIYMCIYIYM